MLTFGCSNFGPQDAIGARAVSVMVGTGLDFRGPGPDNPSVQSVHAKQVWPVVVPSEVTM